MTDAERKLRIYSNVKNWRKESEHRQTKKKYDRDFARVVKTWVKFQQRPFQGNWY